LEEKLTLWTYQLPLAHQLITEQIIPQKQPFVLVTSLLEIAEGGCQTAFTIPEGHVLSDCPTAPTLRLIGEYGAKLCLNDGL
jgi:hypothetical protein